MEGDGVLKSTAGETETGLVSDAKGEKGEGGGKVNKEDETDRMGTS